MERWKYLRGQIADGQFPLLEYLGGTEDTAVFSTACGDGDTPRAAIKLVTACPGNSQSHLTRWGLAARFSHAHLLRIYRTGRCTLDGKDLLYVVMERAEEDLASVLRERFLAPEEARDLLTPTLEALRYLHSKGFVHGSLRPSNILAIGDELKLSSDAICRIGEFREGPHNRRDAYTPPETAGGALSPASDVWSLGITLAECLGGHPPDRDTDARGDLQWARDLPAPFPEFVRHCLLPDPKRRWDVAQLQARLPGYFAGGKESSIRLGAKATRMVRKNWRYALACAVFGLAVVAGGFGMAMVSHGGANSNHTPVGNSPSAVRQPEVVPAKAERSPARSPGGRDGAGMAEGESHAPVASGSEGLGRASVGQLVRGRVARRVLPDVPRDASDTIWGTVRVRVRVDVGHSGNVRRAQFDFTGPSRYFARLSMAAARRWKFRPPIAGGENIPSEWLIRFFYRNDGTRAQATELTP